MSKQSSKQSSLNLNLVKCPKCGSEMKKAVAMNGGESEFWYKCQGEDCHTYLNTYQPQPHQKKFHSDPHRFSANFGGYGSGKTLTTREELYKHIFLTPNANILVGANVMSQYEQTLKRDIENDFPIDFVKNVNTQKAYIDFINGARIMWRPLDDVDKLRSYNLSFFVIMEASEVKAEAFTQLKTRLRSTAPTTSNGVETGPSGETIPVIDHDWRKGIIESNPDNGWIRNDVLLLADSITQTGARETYDQLDSEKDPFISAHVTATSANRYLPSDFIEQNTRNKPEWWVKRYIYGSFLYSQGAVYPGVLKAVCKPVPIRPEWKRIIASDYGLIDNNTFIFAAIDELHNVIYIYKEVVTKEQSVEELAALYKENTKDIPAGCILANLIDPKSGPKRDYNKKSLASYYLDYGICWVPGMVDVKARVMRLNTYLESGRLKIFETCTDLITELREYKFKRDDKANSGYTDKPEDKNNHCINPLEWITGWLPANPENICYGIYNSKGEDLAKEYREAAQYGNFALSDLPPAPTFKDETPYDIQYNIW